jgi:hypothetical protein
MHLQGQSLKVELSVVIVNYNAAPFLRETLTSLQKQQGVSFEVIIVDNGSHDDSRQVARAVMPEAVWIPQKTNLGFSRANNEGIRKATGPVILFLNPDVTFPESDTLQKCLTRLKKNPKIGILTPRVDLVTGGIDMTCHRGFPTPWASFTHFTGLEKIFPHVPFFNEYTKRYLGYETEHEIDAVGGMCMFVPRGVGEELGWWDEDFPFYGEDLDLCFRAHARSYTVWYYPETSVLHHKGVTSGMGKRTRALTTASKATKRQAKIWSVQAMQLFYDKHYRGKYPRLVTLLVHLGIKIMYVIRVGL